MVLWLPVSSHEWLESAGLIHWADQGDQDANHEAADGVCQLDHGNAVVKSPSVSIRLPSALLSELVIKATAAELPVTDIVFHRSTAPPELPKPWQFSERTALPGRAPARAA